MSIVKTVSAIFPFLRRWRNTSKPAKQQTENSHRFHILSDLHLEVGQQYASYPVPLPGQLTGGTHKVVPPYLVLAGDIGRLADYDALLHGFLERIVPGYCRVFYVLGNHEFYGLSYEEGIAAAERLEREPSLAGRLVILNCRRWTDAQSGLVVLGCTLWSDIAPTATAIVQAKLSDFRRITGWTVATHNARHALEAAWLRDQAAACQSSPSTIVIVTHHAPSLQGTSSPRNANNPWTSGFATELLGDGSTDWTKVDLWVFGHTHHCVDNVCCGVRLVANQRGYVLGLGHNDGGANQSSTSSIRDERVRGEVTFNPALVVEVCR